MRFTLPDWINVVPVELPGHGRRFNEPLQTDLLGLVGQLAGELEEPLDLPYVLFGHSLGGLLVFELAHAFRQRGLPAPLTLFVSAAPAPSCRGHRFESAVEQSDAQLLQVCAALAESGLGGRSGSLARRNRRAILPRRCSRAITSLSASARRDC